MSLLDTISKAAAGAGNLTPRQFPIVINADEFFRQLKPESDDSNASSLVRRHTGWEISETDSEAINSVNRFIRKLKRKLKHPKSLSRDEFLRVINSFPAEKLGSVIGGDVVGLIAEGCLVLELWEPLETLVLQGLVRRLNPADLIEKLVEKGRSDILCLCVRHVNDLWSSDLVLILRHFLFPSKESHDTMIKVRKDWESQALSAIDKATRKDVPLKVSNLAKDASVLLMLGHDGFSASELCLHCLFSSPSLDSLVLSSAISSLNGSEVLVLVRYLGKWLEKYEKFPDVVPCPSAGSVLGLRVCEWVPTLESVVKGLGLVLDEHFCYLVWNSRLHSEIKSIEGVVKTLVSEADLCGTLDDFIETLRSTVSSH